MKILNWILLVISILLLGILIFFGVNLLQYRPPTGHVDGQAGIGLFVFITAIQSARLLHLVILPTYLTLVIYKGLVRQRIVQVNLALIIIGMIWGILVMNEIA